MNGKTVTHYVMVKMMLGEPEIHEAWYKARKSIFVGMYWNYVSVPVWKLSEWSNDSEGGEGDWRLKRGINLLWLLPIPTHLAVWCHYSLSLVHDRPTYIVCPGFTPCCRWNFLPDTGGVHWIHTQSLLFVYVFVYLYQRCNVWAHSVNRIKIMF